MPMRPILSPALLKAMSAPAPAPPHSLHEKLAPAHAHPPPPMHASVASAALTASAPSTPLLRPPPGASSGQPALPRPSLRSTYSSLPRTEARRRGHTFSQASSRLPAYWPRSRRGSYPTQSSFSPALAPACSPGKSTEPCPRRVSVRQARPQHAPPPPAALHMTCDLPELPTVGDAETSAPAPAPAPAAAAAADPAPSPISAAAPSPTPTPPLSRSPSAPSTPQNGAALPRGHGPNGGAEGQDISHLLHRVETITRPVELTIQTLLFRIFRTLQVDFLRYPPASGPTATSGYMCLLLLGHVPPQNPWDASWLGVVHARLGAAYAKTDDQSALAAQRDMGDLFQMLRVLVGCIQRVSDVMVRSGVWGGADGAAASRPAGAPTTRGREGRPSRNSHDHDRAPPLATKRRRVSDSEPALSNPLFHPARAN